MPILNREFALIVKELDMEETGRIHYKPFLDSVYIPFLDSVYITKMYMQEL